MLRKARKGWERFEKTRKGYERLGDAMRS